MTPSSTRKLSGLSGASQPLRVFPSNKLIQPSLSGLGCFVAEQAVMASTPARSNIFPAADIHCRILKDLVVLFFIRFNFYFKNSKEGAAPITCYISSLSNPYCSSTSGGTPGQVLGVLPTYPISSIPILVV